MDDLYPGARERIQQLAERHKQERKTLELRHVRELEDLCELHCQETEQLNVRFRYQLDELTDLEVGDDREDRPWT